MKILVVGAGAVGGYFGGRLLQAGRDVTFLVRPRRAAQLAEHGLSIRSRFGDFHRPAPPVVAEQDLGEPFDLIILSCKAYDLGAAIASFSATVGPRTAILPLLNGMRQLDVLADHFGAGRVLGGLCAISVTLGADGVILHLNDIHALAFGELDGRPRRASKPSPRRSSAPGSTRGSATRSGSTCGRNGSSLRRPRA